MGNIDELKHDNKGIWIVLDEDGWPIYCAGWPEACHEHINEAINEHDIDGAEKWKVRRAGLAPNYKDRIKGTVLVHILDPGFLRNGYPIDLLRKP